MPINHSYFVSEWNRWSLHTFLTIAEHQTDILKLCSRWDIESLVANFVVQINLSKLGGCWVK
jgi:hypothetical protein